MNTQLQPVKIDVTRQLAEYAVNLKEQEVTEEALHAAKRCLLDWIGVALGGSASKGADILVKLADQLGGARTVNVIGRERKTDPLHAALINGFMAHVMDYDDTHLDSMLHPSAPIWPAVAAIAEMERKNGKEALIAFVIGYEMGVRVGRVIFPDFHDERGWHVTGLVGAIGAAAGAGRLLGLDLQQMQQALGIAATYGSGLRCMHGTMTKSLHPGKAAMNGLYAALLAREGFTSNPEALEHQRGFFAVNAGKTDMSRAVRNLGESFEIFNNSVKPYASGVITHPLIDAAIRLHAEIGNRLAEIERIVAEVCPMVPDATGIADPKTGLEGKFSVYHCIAEGLVDGHCDPPQFTDERVQHPAFAEVRKKIELKINPQYKEWEAILTVVMKSGEEYVRHIPFASGTAQNPLTDRQLEAKYFAMAKEVLGPDKAKRLAGQIWDLDESVPFERVMNLTAKR